MKGTVTVILLVFVAASVVYMAFGDRGDVNRAATQAEVAQSPVLKTVRTTTGNSAVNQHMPGRVQDQPAAAEAPSEVGVTLQESTEVPRTVIAYYFHRTQRCKTCLTMEAYAQDALQEALSDALESGELEWRAVNVEKRQYEHFVEEYDLYASALVMVEMAGDEVKRSKNLERIWDLVGDESKFKAFVRDEALAYLKDVP
jgi:hypothetical protein